MRLALLSLALLPSLAFAQDTSFPLAGPADAVLGFLFSPTGIGLVLGALALLVGGKEVRRRRVALATYHAFHIVEDLKREVPRMTGLEKAGAALRAADEYMRANGWRSLKAHEEEAARLTLTALHGQQQVDARALVAAANAGMVAVPASPMVPHGS